MGRMGGRDVRREAVVARGTLLLALWLGIVGQTAAIVAPDPAGPTLAAIEGCMARAPTPWPQAWQDEYLDAIRRATISEPNAVAYVTCLDILRRGFPGYWEGLTRTDERALFEVHAAQIRWYVEHLMQVQLPDVQAKHRLREQYTYLWNHAASSLLTQFPFLDPNGVQVAKAERIDECYREIDAPLLPIFQQPFSQEQLGQIEQRWHDLRYARVDLWRQLAGATIPAANQDAPRLDAAASRVLTRKCLAQLLSQLWIIKASPPDYYVAAMRNRVAAQKRAFESRSQAGRAERALDRRYSRQLLQTEQLSFLLAALLETAQYPSSQSARQEGSIQGGDPNGE